MYQLAGRQSVSPQALLPLVILLFVPAAVAVGIAWRVPVGAAAILLATMTLCAASAPLALGLLALLAPFDGYIPPVVLYGDILAFDAVGAALIVGQGIRGFQLPRRAIATPAILSLALLAALHVISLGPANWTQALDNVARFLYLVALVIAIVSARTYVSELIVVVPLLAGTAIRFAYEAQAYLTHPARVFHSSFQFGANTSNPNTLAGLGACVLPLAFAMVLVSRAKIHRATAAMLILLLGGGIIFSFSKGAWLAAAAGLAVFGWHVVGRGLFPRRVAVAAIVVTAIAVAAVPRLRQIPSLMIERWTSHGSTLSNEERYRYLETATRFIVEHPFLGVGLERFGVEYQQARRATAGPEDPHNAYLMVAVELGLPALGCYLLFLTLAFMSSSRRVLASCRRTAVVGAALAGGIGAMLVFQVFNAEPLAARAFWLLAALSLAPVFEFQTGLERREAAPERLQ